ncbi:MAG: right-handed parallel beta-helix repeat-containing protein [Acetatifactor muris]|nr:right-handed parallel beta-helix repeat-containing protein [Acetatifactor muris]
MGRRTRGKILSVFMTVCMLLSLVPADLFGGVAHVQAAASSAEDYVPYSQGEWVADEADATILTRTTTWTFNDANRPSKQITIAGDDTVYGIQVVSGSVSLKTKASDGLNLSANAMIAIPMDEATQSVVITIDDSSKKTDRYYTIGKSGQQLYSQSSDKVLAKDNPVTVTSDNFEDGYLRVQGWVGDLKLQSITIVETKAAGGNEGGGGDTPDTTEYTITVTDGEGKADGAASTVTDAEGNAIATATKGTTVKIKAADAADGMKFSGWTGTTGVKFADAKAAETTFVMPASNVSLETTYKSAQTGGTIVHNFTDSGTASDFFTITGNLSTGKGTVTYEGLTLTQCLKMEGSTSIKFTPENDGVLTLVFVETSTEGAVKVNGTAENSDANGVVQVEVTANTEYTLTKSAKTNLFYMSLEYGGVIGGPATATKYAITVTDGEGKADGAASTVTDAAGNAITEATAGTTVKITAAAAAEGKRFNGWTGTAGVTFADASKASTSFVMPASAVTITTNYVAEAAKYSLTVAYDDGEPTVEQKAEGSTVTVRAKSIEGKEFDKWVVVSGTVTLKDATAAETTFTMPGSAVSLKATYKEANKLTPDSSVSDVKVDASVKLEFTNAEGDEVRGQIVIHAETKAAESVSAEIQTAVANVIASVPAEDQSKVKTLYYDISAYLNSVADANKVNMTSGKVKIQFAYPEGVSRRNEIIALHNTATVPVEKSDSGFTIVADGFSPYTVIIKPVAEASIAITAEGGYEEGAYAEWSPVAGADGYLAYVNTSATSYTDNDRIDNELIRKYADHWRVDTVGLKPGSYYIHVVAATVGDGGAVTPIAEAATGALEVTNYDRSGFAFSGDSPFGNKGAGAYNNDGTLKEGAQVIYVTPETAKTCTAMLHTGGASKPAVKVTGIQAILDGKQKSGTENDILDIRIIGCVKKDDLDYISSKAEGLQIKGKANYNEMNITIEGIGEDATVHGFGFLVRNCGNVEFRNFAIMAFMDDGISLDTANCNIWIHDMDIFYGSTGGDSDQAKGDGSIDVKGKSTYITISYNHFWDSGKSSLCGMGDSEEFMVTYHHNWFDHSDSRHARVRVGSIHFYNNYYDGNSKYGVGVTKASSAFVEANYFRNCKYPMLISMQGSDIANGNKGTFSGEPGGMIKAYNNHIEGATRLVYANTQGVQGATDPKDSKEFDAYLAETREETVDEFYVTVSGKTPYNNFDTSYDLGVTADRIDDPEQVVTIVTSKAGRLNGGDFTWTFTDADDADYSVNAALKSKVVGYTSSVLQVGGIGKESSGSGTGGGGSYQPGEGSDDRDDTGDGDLPELNTGTVHNFTTDGQSSAYYAISGSMKDKPDTMTYGGLTLSKALKMDSSASITFKTAGVGTLILVQTPNKRITVDGTIYTSDASGVLRVENLAAGDHDISKKDSPNLYYIAFLTDGSADPNPPVEGSYKVTVTNGTTSAATAKAGDRVTISANAIAGKAFEKWVVKAGKVTLANEASATTSFTMPASAVTVEAQYTDAATPDVPDTPGLKDFDLNVGRDFPTETALTENTTKNGFTILADATNKVDFDDKGKEISGVKYTRRLKTGGTGTATNRSIMFTTEDAAKITVIAVSSNGSDKRTMGLAVKNAAGKLEDLDTKSVGTSASTYTFTVDQAGTYYLHSSSNIISGTKSGGLNFFYIGVSYETASENPGGVRVDDEVREQAPDFKDGDLYVSTKGLSTAAGSFEDPMDLKTALNTITPGHTIWMFSGTYYAYDMYQEPLIIEESNSGTADAMKRVSSINGKRVTIDFDGMAEEGSNRGITLDGSYWYFYDIDICNAGDNGMLLSGDHNTLELCQFYGNHDTGLQLSRYNTNYNSKDQWPSYNLILNCTAYNNKDLATTENADGFAAKLTCGEGNVFDGCIAYCNSDDGWDLFAKTATGPIGQVTLRNCVSFGNGKLTDGQGSANGDMNGFKLGGSGVATDHIVENCLAFNNGATGFTDNNNPGNHTIINCTAVNNGRFEAKANLMLYRAASGAQYTNILSSVDSKGAETDQFLGTMNYGLYHYKDGKENGSYYWVDSYAFSGVKEKYAGSEKAKYTVTNDDFVKVTIPGYNPKTAEYTANYHEIFRNPDGSVNMDGLFEVKETSPLYTAGKDGTYIGAKFSKDGAPQTYTVSVEGGSASPVKAEAGATVTITAEPAPGMVFDKWTVKTGGAVLADATAAETTFTMPANLVEIVAEYKKAESPVHNISITGGTASPAQAAVGTKVEITANAAPEGKVFSRWVVKSGGIVLADPTSATTTFTMGSALVELEAEYKDAPATPVDPTNPTNPTEPTNPTNPTEPVQPTEPDTLTVVGDGAVVSGAVRVAGTTFTKADGEKAKGEIIIHAEGYTPTAEILKAVEQYTKLLEDPSKAIIHYYDIKAYEGIIDSAHVVTLNGQVKLKFAYPAGVTRDGYDIIVLHNTYSVPVEKEADCFWVTADGFSPYTFIYLQKDEDDDDTSWTDLPVNANKNVSPKTYDYSQYAEDTSSDGRMIGGAAVVMAAPKANSTSAWLFVLIAVVAGAAAVAFRVLAFRKAEEE